MWISSAATSSYLSICTKAANDTGSLGKFKSLPSYFYPVGLTEPLYAVDCFKTVQRNPVVFTKLQDLVKIDTIGKPLMKIGGLSTEAVRFAHSVARIQEAFGDMTGKRVVEFGSNIGNLAYMLLTTWPGIAQYNLVDLPEVTNLAKVYLSALGLSNPALTDAEPSGSCDLFIAEYSLTEFTEDDLYPLTDKHCGNAQNIFIRCNVIQASACQRWIDYLRKDFQLTVEDESPVRPLNKIVIGKR
jgi:hypothetical protein